ncbi:iron chelate uptake ABC transporter family permease subunit [Phyllobacterium sp. YR531]|uniref:FecCD family ABC transporter permease n=1 Tax=Phyllobacterium sp. YR531 TaxID=1144343 RepID=UPI00026F872D|nr:iron chelate uptake ABC transporter family permease subunit [Phyllobacterium sp. YR531]EJN03601.1 ABC-type Fe3+-siderophore transport system, permease component [Phyllobacterium sp. YR531]
MTSLPHKITEPATRKNVFVVWAALLSALLFLSLLGMTLGAVPLSISEVMTALGGGKNAFIVLEYRAPRVLVSIMAGAAFALSGALLQNALRNPIASPDVIGITKGAGLGALAAVILLPPAWSIWAIPAGIAIGSTLALFLLLAIGQRLGGSVTTIALVGVALGALAQAITHFLMVSYPAKSDQAMLWLAGTVFGTSGHDVLWLALWLLVCLPIVVLISNLLDLTGFGDDNLSSLGINPRWARACLVIVAVALVAGAVASVGSVGFLGLIAPQIAKAFVSQRARYLLPTSALVGALLLSLADLVGRLIALPNEIPAGIVSAVVGGPYLLYLLYREARSNG